MYTETAYSMLLLAEWGWRNPQLLLAGAEKTESLKAFFAGHSHIPYMPYSCKPLWDFMNVAAVAVGGYNDAVSAGLSALMGTLGILAIYWLGRALYGERVGLCAAAFMAVAGGGLVFSRYGQSHMASLVFLMLGSGLYLRSLSRPLCWRPMARSSLFFGLALATHPNLLPNVGLFGLYEVCLLVRQEMPWKSFVRRGLAMAGSLAAVVVLLDLPFELMKYLFGGFFDAMAPRMGWPFMTYLAQLSHHFSLVMTDAAPGWPERVYTYLVVPWAWEGAAMVALVAASSFRWLGSMRRSSVEDVIVHTQVLLPLLFWVCSENQAVYRFASGILPAAVVIAARQLERMAQFVLGSRRRHTDLVMAVLAASVVAYTFENSRAIYGARSAYKEAAHWLLVRGQDRVMAVHPHSWRFYGVTPEPPSAAGLIRVQYMAFYPRYMGQRERAARAVLEGQKPALRVPDIRPGKLLEVQFVQRSLVLKLLVGVPGIGPCAARMRDVVLDRNADRCLEVYEINEIRAKLAAVL
jgi:4-amino-4-deoxy-L-arabinose transferase-like glycosyltransferase